MQFFVHVGYPVIALVAAPDFRLSQAMPRITPGLAAGGTDHQRQKAPGRQAKRLAFDKPPPNPLAELADPVNALARERRRALHSEREDTFATLSEQRRLRCHPPDTQPLLHLLT